MSNKESGREGPGAEVNFEERGRALVAEAQKIVAGMSKGEAIHWFNNLATVILLEIEISSMKES